MAEAQPWNFEGKFCSLSSDSFDQMNGDSMLPVTPMESVTPPATKDRDSKVRKSTDPIISTEAPPACCKWNYTKHVLSTPRHSTCSTKGVAPVRYTPSEEITVMECSGNFRFICAGLYSG